VCGGVRFRALKARESYATRDLSGTPGAGQVIFTTTLASVMFTVLGMGAGIYGILGHYQAFARGDGLEEDQVCVCVCACARVNMAVTADSLRRRS
jgi:hypothetical protein